MTEEPNKSEAPLPEKLLIDDSMNFPFHAAYVVYAELFDNIHDADTRAELTNTTKGFPCKLREKETGERKLKGKIE
jgi:hypothetical protein